MPKVKKHNMKYIKYLFVTLLIIGNVVFSQEINNDEIKNNFGKLRAFDSTSKDLVGTSYIVEDFLPAKLAGNNTIYSMRFNAYQDEMEVSKDGEEYSLQKKINFPVTFISDNKTYEVYNYLDNKTEKLGFFIVLFKNENIALLLKEKIKYIPEIKAKTGYDKYQPPSLVRSKDILYLGYKNNTTTELPKNKKEFYILFAKNSENIKKYVKDKNLSIKDVEDLIKIFEFYNTLK